MNRIYSLIIMMVVCSSFLLITCHDLNSPIDPQAKDYNGIVSTDNDVDGIGMYADVDEIVLLSPANGATVDTAAPVLNVYKFDPKKINKY